MFNPELPYVSVPLDNRDGLLHRNIKASYPKNGHKVVAELNALFGEQQSAAHSPKSVEGLGFALESSCDAISRCHVLSRKGKVVSMINDILRVADELDHHPTITVSGGIGASWLLCITCMTHRPPGLSVKDPRLARKINEILSDPCTATQEAPSPNTEFIKVHAASVFKAKDSISAMDDRKTTVTKALTAELLSVFKAMIWIHPLLRDQAVVSSITQSTANTIRDPAKLADFAASISATNKEELDDVLQTTNTEDKLQKALILLKKEANSSERRTRDEIIDRAEQKRSTEGLAYESQTIDTRLWHWQQNIGRAQPQLDIAEEDGMQLDDEDETSFVRGLNFWRLNNAEDVRIFSEQNQDPAPSTVPIMRGLIP